MKKIYMSPKMDVVEIKVQQMLTSSPGAPLDPSDTVNPGEVEAPQIQDVLMFFAE